MANKKENQDDKITKSDRIKKLKRLANAINKKTDGTDTTIGFGLKDYGRITTGIKGWDQILGGGYPKGKFVTIAGPEQTCKGTACAKCIATNQKKGAIAAWIDAEQALDAPWMEKQGVDCSELFIIEKDTMENMFDNTLKILRDNLIDIIVIDSLGGLLPRGEQESKTGGNIRSMNDDTIGLLQRKMSQFLRLSCGPAAKTNTTIFMIGQVYTDINSYGGLELVKGGNAVKHFTHLRIKTRRGSKSEAPMAKIDNKEKPIGFMHYMKIHKTRQTGTGPEGSEIRYPFIFNHGFHEGRFEVDQLIESGKVVKKGPWYYVGEEKFQGKEEIYSFADSNDLSSILEKANSEKKKKSEEKVEDEEKSSESEES